MAEGTRLAAGEDGERPLNWFYASPAVVSRLPGLFESGVVAYS